MQLLAVWLIPAKLTAWTQVSTNFSSRETGTCSFWCVSLEHAGRTGITEQAGYITQELTGSGIQGIVVLDKYI